MFTSYNIGNASFALQTVFIHTPYITPCIVIRIILCYAPYTIIMRSVS